MKVLDLHSDIITDIAHRRLLGETKVFERRHLPLLRQGGVFGLICVLWVEPIFRHNPYQRFQQLLRLAIEDLKECREVKLMTRDSQLNEDDETDSFFIWLGLEGLTFMEQWDGSEEKEKVSNAVHTLSDYQINHAILAWNEANFLATGTGVQLKETERGLTPVGKHALKMMEENHWLVDVSHLDEASFWDVLATTNGPIMASHSNAKSLCNVERNLNDAQLKAIAERNGIIGLNAYGEFVSDTNPNLERFVDHIEYITQLIGVEHVGLGFDFTDYIQRYNVGDGKYVPTKDLENVTKVPLLIEKLLQRGFQESDIKKICYQNALRFIKNSL